jgi:hypothetical protein
MSQQIADRRSAMPARHAPTDAPETPAWADARLDPSLGDLADELRDRGHAVHAKYAGTRSHEDHQLVGIAIQFIERTLALSTVTESRHAYIRLYHSTDLLFLEVTPLRPRPVNPCSPDTDAQHDLDELNRWAVDHDHLLSVRRGPRGQLKIALMVKSPDAATRTPALAAGRAPG